MLLQHNIFRANGVKPTDIATVKKYCWVWENFGTAGYEESMKIYAQIISAGTKVDLVMGLWANQ